MMYMIEKKYTNEDLEIELTSFIDEKQNVWFRGKEIAEILGYVKTDQAIRIHVDERYKKSYPLVSRGQVRHQYFISEPGFYYLYLVPNYQLLKNSKIGYSPLYSHQSPNMANTNYLIVPGIR